MIDWDNPRCECCGVVPNVDPGTDEYDLYQNCHVGGSESQWWCGECMGAKNGEYPACPDEFLNADGECSVCDMGYDTLEEREMDRLE